MKHLLLLLFVTPVFAESPSPFALAKRCLDSYRPAMRNVDTYPGDLWALPREKGSYAIVKARGEKFEVYEADSKVGQVCYRRESPSIATDVFSATACPANVQEKKVSVDEQTVAADLLNRIATDMRGLNNELKKDPAQPTQNEALAREARYLAFQPRACEETVTRLGSSSGNLGKEVALLKAELATWKELFARSRARPDEPGKPARPQHHRQ